MNNQPLVSVVITNFNRENTIAKAIESALEQDYSNLEIIVSDNCSTDNSNVIISKYLIDKRIKYFRNVENIGMLNNFKVAIEDRASGDYVTTLNSDDEFINCKFISDCINLILQHPNIVIAKSGFETTIKNVSTFTHYNEYNTFYIGTDFLSKMNTRLDFGWTGILLKRDVLNSIKIFEKKIIGADYICNLKMLLEGNICFYNTPSYKYYLHHSNASLSSYNINQLEILLEEINDFFSKLKEKVKPEEFAHIQHKIKLFYIKSAYHNNYIQNRKDIELIIKALKEFDSKIFSEHLNQPATKQFILLFYFPKLGKILTKLKKKLFI